MKDKSGVKAIPALPFNPNKHKPYCSLFFFLLTPGKIFVESSTSASSSWSSTQNWENLVSAEYEHCTFTETPCQSHLGLCVTPWTAFFLGTPSPRKNQSMHREHAAQHSSLQARTEGRYSWDINVEVNQGQTDCRAQNLLQKGWKVKVSAAMSISVITQLLRIPNTLV